MNRIRTLREAQGWSQDDLGLRLNVKRAAISKYETGSISLSDETLGKLADVFSVSIDYLLGRTDDPLPIRDVDQDIHDEHDYDKELQDFLKDRDLSAKFHNYGSWSEEEKMHLLHYMEMLEATRGERLKNVKPVPKIKNED